MIKPFFTLFLLMLLTQPVLADESAETVALYSRLNAWRAGKPVCNGQMLAGLPALAVTDSLTDVARRASAGVPMAKAMPQGIGAFRAKLLVVGAGSNEKAIDLLQSRFCTDLLNPAYTRFGATYAQGRWWLVLAEIGNEPSAVVLSSGGQWSARLLELINQARAEARTCGDKYFAATTPLRLNERLSVAAENHAADMLRQGYFAHADKDGKSVADRVRAAGYSYRVVGENLAFTPVNDPDKAVDGWIKSPGHCANLMNPAFAELGVGVAAAPSASLGKWVTVYGR